jgi:hypothetical protein
MTTSAAALDCNINFSAAARPPVGRAKSIVPKRFLGDGPRFQLPVAIRFFVSPLRFFYTSFRTGVSLREKMGRRPSSFQQKKKTAVTRLPVDSRTKSKIQLFDDTRNWFFVPGVRLAPVTRSLKKKKKKELTASVSPHYPHLLGDRIPQTCTGTTTHVQQVGRHLQSFK